MTNGRVWQALAVVIAAFAVPAATAEEKSAQPPAVVIGKPYVSQKPEWTGELIAFVGRRLEVEYLGTGDFDEAYRARYQVLSMVHGQYPGETLEFTAFDHYGYPPFGEYDTALLYVVKLDGKFFHEMYLFDPVFPTADGRWAGCGDPYKSEHEPVSRDVKAHVTNYLSVPMVHRRAKGAPSVNKLYPTNEFVRSGARVRCKRGAYAEELFEIIRHGVLARRGYSG